MPRPDQGVRTTALIQPTSTSVGNVIHALQTTKGRLNACPSLFISLKPNKRESEGRAANVVALGGVLNFTR